MIALIIAGVTILAAGSLFAVSAMIRQVTRPLSAEMSNRSGMPENAKPGVCLKDGQDAEYEVVACTTPGAIHKITHVFTDMTMAAFDARMANGGDVCPEGERTIAYSGEDPNAKVSVYCLAWAATPAASQLAEAEADEVRSPSFDYKTAKINDCLSGGNHTDYNVVPCADKVAKWKIAKKTVATRAELDSESPDNRHCNQDEVTVSHWSSEHPQAQADVLCLARLQ